MHHIQRKILNKLLYTTGLGYAALRPEGVTSNHYAYHLEQLIKDNLVAKHDKRYALSPRGLAHVDRMSQAMMVGRLQPHIVTAIDIINDQGKTLLFKRAFQPYINSVGFPLGKTHYDESVLAAAERELSEKTGLRGVALTHRGIVYVEARQDDTVISKIVCHVFQGSVSGEPAVGPDDTYRGASYWGDAAALAPGECMPGFLAIKRLLSENDSFFFAELSEVYS